MNDPNLKRRVNSIATSYNLGGVSNSSQAQLTHNNQSLFPSTSTHHVGPNATHLLQNSSLASSARLNASSSSSAATASVLGNNSSLSHAFNSLQQQQSHQQQSAHNNSGLNFNLNSSPSSSGGGNSGLLSALSLSTSSSASLANQLLSASGKPLRSERLPSHVVDEIIKQAKIRRRMGGKKEVIILILNAFETPL